MTNRYINEIRRINYICNEMEHLYHQASLKLGISDSVSIILYTIYDNGNECMLSDIYKQSGISRQTVNSAIRKLEKDEIVYLELYNGKSKKVLLTEKGKEYAKKTVAKILVAENAAYEGWDEEEISTYIRLQEKYRDCFREQVEKI